MRGAPAIFEQPGRGGVNLQDAPYTLKDYEARDARNVVSTSRGAVRKRDGAVTFATPGVALTSLFASQSPRYLIGAGGTLIYSIDPAGTVAVIATGMTSGLAWQWVSAPASGGQGPVWGMNGTDTPRQWTGAGNTAVWTAAAGVLPNGRYLIYAANRVFVAGMSAYGTLSDPGSALVFSNLADPRDWPAANVVLFDPGDGDAITGLGTVGPMVLVFKSGKAWVVYDTDTGANRRLAESVGCVSHRTIVETPDGTFFLSKDHGVMVTNGSSVRRVSDRVLPLIESMSQAKRASATARYFNDHYYLCFPTGGAGNDVMLDYDAKADVWWIHTLPEQDLAVWESGAVPQLYGAKATSALVDRLFVGGQTQDNGQSFASYWNGPFHAFGKPHLRKRMRQIAFDGSGRIQLSITRDFRRSQSLQGEKSFGTDVGAFGVNDTSLFAVNDTPEQYFGGVYEVAQARVANPGVARAWSIQFGNQTADDFEVDSYTCLLTERTN